MKKLQNIPALLMAITFSVFLLSRLGKADTPDIILYGVAVFSMLLFFISGNIKPKNAGNADTYSRRRTVIAVGAGVAITAFALTLYFFSNTP